MSKKEKIIMITIITMILVLTIINVPRLLISKQVEELPEVKLKPIDKEDNNMFAIMVQKETEDGYEEYKESTWPSDKYVYKEAKCMDNNGELIEEQIVKFTNNKAVVTTDKTVYCILYFDKKPKSTLDTLREKDINGNLSPDDSQGGMYRYQGTDDVPNWICFGTRDKDACTDETDNDSNSIPDGIDKYMYRIIGITEEGQLYLLKETFLKDGNTTKFQWNSKYFIKDCKEDTCEWPNADLFKRINGTSNGENQGTTSDNANTDIFVDSEYYDYLKSGDNVNGTTSPSEWYQMIAVHKWKYGDTYETKYNGPEMYAIETGRVETYVTLPGEGQETCSYTLPCYVQKYTWSKDIDAKISLMYIHDYAYAYSDGKNEKTRGVPANGTNVEKSWIYFIKDGFIPSYNMEWLISRFGMFSPYADGIQAKAVIDDDSHAPLDGIDSLLALNGVRPVFYLESNAKISSGDGTKENPFILGTIS